MCSASGWTGEATALLIDLYQGEEALYFVKAKDYHNKFARQNALERIVKNVSVVKPDVTVAQVKAKINALRSRYTTELAKIKCTHSGMGTEDGYKVTFEFFENLQFLCNHVQARKGSLNMPLSAPVEQDTEVDLSETFTEQTVEQTDPNLSGNWVDDLEMSEANVNENPKNLPTKTSTPRHSPAVTTEPSRKRKKGLDASDRFLQAAQTTLEKLSSSGPPATDEWHDFGVFIRNSVKKLKTENLQMKCKHKILRAIMECEEQNV